MLEASRLKARNELMDMARTHQHAARTDELTGLSNRRDMQHRLNEEYSRYRRSGHHFSIVLIDLDRSVRPDAKLANILRWEGIIIDPVGALLAVLVFEGIVSWGQGNVFSHSLYIFGKTLAVGFLIGAVAGWLNGIALRKHLLPQYLHNAGTLTFMLGVYALSNEMAHE